MVLLPRQFPETGAGTSRSKNQYYEKKGVYRNRCLRIIADTQVFFFFFFFFFFASKVDE